MATPDYSKIWGANSPLAKYEFTEADYLRGWEFIGSMPPARTMFDAWMRKADEKMRWLYDNAFSENSLGGFLFWRLPDTAYFVGEKRALQDGPLDVYIECTIAGRTSKEQMKKLPQGAEIGKTFVDGTATWLVRQFVTSAALADHRTKMPLDHPDGSVLKRHLGFEVYDKDETYAKSEIDSRVNGKVSKSGDTINGQLIFAHDTNNPGGNSTVRSIFPAHYYHNYWSNDSRNVYIHAYPSVDPPEGDTCFAFRIGEGNKRYHEYVLNKNGFLLNGKDLWASSIYASGKIRSDAGFDGNLKGTADNANKLGDKSLQWILEQINAAKTGIVAGNLEQNGWIKFANGLIVQWGMGSEQISEDAQTVTFPITFSRGCFSLITGTILSVSGTRNDSMWQVATVGRERAVLFHQHFTVDGVGKTKPTYIAIGV